MNESFEELMKKINPFIRPKQQDFTEYNLEPYYDSWVDNVGEDEEIDIDEEDANEIFFEDYDKDKKTVVRVTPDVAKVAIQNYINDVGKNIEIFDKKYIDSKLVEIEGRIEEYLKNKVDNMTEKIMKQIVEREFNERVTKAVNEKIAKISRLLNDNEL